MKRVQIFICNSLVLALLTFTFSKTFAQQVFKTTTHSVIAYLEYLPDGYATNSDKYPVMIFLHGAGEKGPNSTDPAILNSSISLVTRHGPPKFVKNGYRFPFILISPQLKNNYGTWPAWYIDEVVEHVKTYLRVDESRIYVTGLSLGGGGAWVYAENYPEKIAALAPICGGYNSTSNACKISQNHVPVWAFHGDKDTVVPLSRTTNMVNAINACVPAPSPTALLTVYAGVAHNAWDYSYRTDNSLHTPNLYDWMMSFSNLKNGSNLLPKANAGSDITITLPVNGVNITGSGTDINGTISSYIWNQVAGPAQATLTNSSAPVLSVSSLAQGIYTFKLSVTDNENGKDSDYVTVTVNASSGNLSPIVSAGTDKTVTLPTNSVTLTGNASDPDGTITSYSWAKISGPPAWLSNPKTPALTALNLIEGTYTFRVTVTDDKGASGFDDVIVTVAKAVTTNMPPQADAGPDETIFLPTNSVTLTGNCSDTDGSVTSYEWKKMSGPPAWLNNPKTSTLTAINLIEGTYVFRLTITDNQGASAYDEATVIVAKGTLKNVLPTVSAGPDKIVLLPATSITLTGVATDADGSIKSFEWKKVAGPPAWMTNPRTATLTASNLIEGTYTFSLTVTDDQGASCSDTAVVTVTEDSTTNKAPYANAGPDLSITLPTNSVTLSGTGLDLDGSVVRYEWKKISGPPAWLNNPKTSTLTAINLIEGTYTFRLTVTDNKGSTGYDNAVVVVNKAMVMSTSSGSRLSTAMEDSYNTVETVEGANSSEDPDLSERFNFNQQCSCPVTIFDEAGTKIFAGIWTPDRYNDVFSKGGLYIYHVHSDNNRIEAGKMYVVKK